MSAMRQVRVQQTDDLRSIALRELNNPARWPELSAANGLRPPYIVASYRAEDRLPHTLIWGDTLLVPAETNSARISTPASALGTDILLQHGRLDAANGDLSLISGVENLVQALSHRIKTLRSEIVYHAQYGSHVSLALGLQSKPIVELMAGAWVTESLREEPRVALIEAVRAGSDGDALRIEARVIATTDNTPVDFNLVLNP